MNNFEKYYLKTKEMIDLLYEPIVRHDDNYENEKRKILKKIGSWNDETRLENFLTLQNLIDFTYLGLNREKIENAVDLKWESYELENFKKYPNLHFYKNSKIPYFKDFISVVDCKQKYLTETPNFWIQKIRNGYMHGNFEFEYNRFSKQNIKIKEGTPTKVDVDMNIMHVGLHEFINDNFYNIQHNEFGFASNWVSIIFADGNLQVQNRKELEELLKTKLIVGFRKTDKDFYYDGKNIINSVTGKVASREEKTKKVQIKDGKFFLPSHDYVNPEMNACLIAQGAIDILINVLERENIYHASKQKNKISKAIRNYLFPMECVNRLLHEIDSFSGALMFDKKEYADIGIDIKKMLAVFHEDDVNIKNTFTILNLYRFLYKIQNKNLNDLDYDKLFCMYHFIPKSKERFEERVDKFKLNDDENVATNKAYIETIRNALAHGNVKLDYYINEGQVAPYFEFNDVWTNRKTGIEETVSVMSTAGLLNEFLDRIDEKAWEDDYEVINFIKEEADREKK